MSDNPFDIPDDPYRVAGPGELPEDHEDYEDEECMDLEEA